MDVRNINHLLVQRPHHPYRCVHCTATYKIMYRRVDCGCVVCANCANIYPCAGNTQACPTSSTKVWQDTDISREISKMYIRCPYGCGTIGTVCHILYYHYNECTHIRH